MCKVFVIVIIVQYISHIYFLSTLARQSCNICAVRSVTNLFGKALPVSHLYNDFQGEDKSHWITMENAIFWISHQPLLMVLCVFPTTFLTFSMNHLNEKANTLIVMINTAFPEIICNNCVTHHTTKKIQNTTDISDFLLLWCRSKGRGWTLTD